MGEMFILEAFRQLPFDGATASEEVKRTLVRRGDGGHLCRGMLGAPLLLGAMGDFGICSSRIRIYFSDLEFWVRRCDLPPVVFDFGPVADACNCWGKK